MWSKSLSRRTKINLVRDISDILRSKRYWIKNSSAIDKDGEPVEPTSQSAHCFCLTGAIDRASNLNQRNYWLCKQWVCDEIAEILESDSSAKNKIGGVKYLVEDSNIHKIIDFNDHDLTLFRDIRRIINKLRRKLGLTAAKKSKTKQKQDKNKTKKRHKVST